MTVRVRIRLTPRASRSALTVERGLLRARVTAPAQEGRANAALRALLAEALRVRPSEVAIVAGERSREKLVELPDRAAARLHLLLDRT